MWYIRWRRVIYCLQNNARDIFLVVAWRNQEQNWKKHNNAKNKYCLQVNVVFKKTKRQNISEIWANEINFVLWNEEGWDKVQVHVHLLPYYQNASMLRKIQWVCVFVCDEILWFSKTIEKKKIIKFKIEIACQKKTEKQKKRKEKRCLAELTICWGQNTMLSILFYFIVFHSFCAQFFFTLFCFCAQ